MPRAGGSGRKSGRSIRSELQCAMTGPERRVYSGAVSASFSLNLPVGLLRQDFSSVGPRPFKVRPDTWQLKLRTAGAGSRSFRTGFHCDENALGVGYFACRTWLLEDVMFDPKTLRFQVFYFFGYIGRTWEMKGLPEEESQDTPFIEIGTCAPI